MTLVVICESSAQAVLRQTVIAKSWNGANGAPRPMKMGNIVSP
jgi:hypothetical protein